MKTRSILAGAIAVVSLAGAATAGGGQSALDGHWHLRRQAPHRPFDPTAQGTYTVSGDLVSFVWQGGPRSTTLRWMRVAGGLRLTYVRGGEPSVQIARTLFTAHVWRRVS
ncbi:MAG TPA: hypothetical protein VFA66_06940 [Gaiellaceae bacterium]|nr:hypothetical protein [Gaiellaceae bacterium]